MYAMITALATIEAAAGSPPSACSPPAGFPPGAKVVSLYAALETIQSGSACIMQVCSFDDMKQTAGNLTIRPNQALSITGNLSAPGLDGGSGPRLWARFVVAGTLFLSSLTVRDQAVVSKSYDDPLNGAAAWVRPQGRLVATNVNFLRLSNTHLGGAVLVGDRPNNGVGAVVEFYRCLFDGNQVTKAPGGAGGAMKFEGGATGIISGCVFRDNRAGEDGGAIELNNNGTQHPYSTNITITDTTFASNRAGFAGDGDDIKVWSQCTGSLAVPCPAPGFRCQEKSCALHCCVAGNQTNWSYVLPTA